ncbi:MAG: hypothetical protein A2075_16740 [Geobacteraceae bacterium GWC2_58_44]|nr:MAG: hypothetical protein A2075_16740 [Geobacteraceae bacterium GWC2_58_44]
MKSGTGKQTSSPESAVSPQIPQATLGFWINRLMSWACPFARSPQMWRLCLFLQRQTLSFPTILKGNLIFGIMIQGLVN